MAGPSVEKASSPSIIAAGPPMVRPTAIGSRGRKLSEALLV